MSNVAELERIAPDGCRQLGDAAASEPLGDIDPWWTVLKIRPELSFDHMGRAPRRAE
ncbi:hypothetical protein [Streptomyces sp. NPDC088254]|uniref:hypothetical protein n=1 Tax=Streptomyces sp. NPDC088254 TaxID=3365847 RepID=UPI00380371D1